MSTSSEAGSAVDHSFEGSPALQFATGLPNGPMLTVCLTCNTGWRMVKLTASGARRKMAGTRFEKLITTEPVDTSGAVSSMDGGGSSKVLFPKCSEQGTEIRRSRPT
jgi:hypothetical protein